jgi:hypothetical protein
VIDAAFITESTPTDCRVVALCATVARAFHADTETIVAIVNHTTGRRVDSFSTSAPPSP